MTSEHKIFEFHSFLINFKYTVHSSEYKKKAQRISENRNRLENIVEKNIV